MNGSILRLLMLIMIIKVYKVCVVCVSDYLKLSHNSIVLSVDLQVYGLSYSALVQIQNRQKTCVITEIEYMYFRLGNPSVLPIQTKHHWYLYPLPWPQRAGPPGLLFWLGPVVEFSQNCREIFGVGRWHKRGEYYMWICVNMQRTHSLLRAFLLVEDFTSQNVDVCPYSWTLATPLFCCSSFA